jgi:AmiR/NasT family two-component response regulator
MSQVVLLTSDLMFVAKFQASATRVGVSGDVAMSNEALLAKAVGAGLVICDLTKRGLDIAAVVVELRALTTPPKKILAFGPHVQTALLQAAHEAGCDLVLTRGQFDAQLDTILANAAG